MPAMPAPKVFLFVPPGGYFAERWSGGSMMPALGLSSIAAVLERDGVDVRLVPCHVLGLDWKDVGRLIETERPDVVGVTTTTENRFLSFRLAQVAKEAHPGVFTVLGGPHVKNTAQDTLEHVRAVDAVCLGEGEETMSELVRCLAAKGDLGKVAGISWRDGDGTVRHNAARLPIADLNLLPLPARHLEPWGKYNFRIEVPARREAAHEFAHRLLPLADADRVDGADVREGVRAGVHHVRAAEDGEDAGVGRLGDLREPEGEEAVLGRRGDADDVGALGLDQARNVLPVQTQDVAGHEPDIHPVALEYGGDVGEAEGRHHAPAGPALGEIPAGGDEQEDFWGWHGAHSTRRGGARAQDRPEAQKERTTHRRGDAWSEFPLRG